MLSYPTALLFLASLALLTADAESATPSLGLLLATAGAGVVLVVLLSWVEEGGESSVPSSLPAAPLLIAGEEDGNVTDSSSCGLNSWASPLGMMVIGKAAGAAAPTAVTQEAASAAIHPPVQSQVAAAKEAWYRRSTGT